MLQIYIDFSDFDTTADAALISYSSDVRVLISLNDSVAGNQLSRLMNPAQNPAFTWQSRSTSSYLAPALLETERMLHQEGREGVKRLVIVNAVVPPDDTAAAMEVAMRLMNDDVTVIVLGEHAYCMQYNKNVCILFRC